MKTIKWRNIPGQWNGERGRFTDFAARRYGPAGPDVIGAEIGVLNGDHVLEFFDRPFMPIKRFYLIDPYEAYSDYHDHNRTGVDAAKDKAISVLGSLHTWNPMCEEETFQWLFSQSSIAIDAITDLLDFVYIDGNHAKEYAYADLWNYVELVKVGGIIGGHDYYHREDPTNLCGVKEVVDEFHRLTDSTLYLDGTCEQDWPDWWFIKNEAMTLKLAEIRRKGSNARV